MQTTEALSLKRGALLFHTTEKNKDNSQLRVRVNGNVKTWKKRPDDFRVPIKYGYKGPYGYVTPENADKWSIKSNEDVVREEAFQMLIQILQPESTVYTVAEHNKSGSKWLKLFAIRKDQIINITVMVSKLISHYKLTDRNGEMWLYSRSGDFGMIQYNLAAAVNLPSNSLAFKSL